MHGPPTTTRQQDLLAQRLHRLSGVVRMGIVLSTPLLLILPLSFLLLPAEPLRSLIDQPSGLNLLPLMQGELSLAARLRIAAATMLPIGLGLALLWQLWRLFGEFRTGRVFSPLALRSLSRFGWLLLASALLTPLGGAAMSIAASWDNAEGQRVVQASISSDDWFRGLLGLVFIALAKVNAEAARVTEENDGFV
jgi:hypothetical protein